MSFIECNSQMVNTRSGRELSRVSPARPRRPLYSPPRGPGVIRVVTGSMAIPPPPPRPTDTTNIELAVTFAVATALVVFVVGPSAIFEGLTTGKEPSVTAAAAATAWRLRPFWPFST